MHVSAYPSHVDQGPILHRLDVIAFWCVSSGRLCDRARCRMDISILNSPRLEDCWPIIESDGNDKCDAHPPNFDRFPISINRNGL